MDQSVRRLNELSAGLAEAELLKCCGSTRWAKRMSDARPFANLEQLCAKADETWASLEERDWLEAFRAHPKIGETKAEAAQSPQAAGWSVQEQSRAQVAAADTRVAIAEGNKTYEARFGFIFIICASGKSADEILAALNARLANGANTELHIAAEEQRKITQLRLKKLLTT